MSKRPFIVLFLLLILSLSATASVLWRVSRGDGRAASYLFGTEHPVPGRFLPDQARAALDSCETVVSEVDLNEFTGEATYLAEQLQMTDGTTLHDLFTREQLDSIDALFCMLVPATCATGITQFMADSKPIALTLMIQRLLTASVIGHDSEHGLDEHVQQIARTSGKPVIGLETARFQIDLLLSESPEEMAADLMEIVRDPDDIIAQLRELTDCYLAGDLGCIEEIVNRVSRVSVFTDALIEDRNRAWAERLPAIIDSTPAFIAVGAAHLPGPDGLISLLRRAGYTVEETDCTFDTILEGFSR